MKLSSAYQNIYNKSFKILFWVFIGVLALEFAACMSGNTIIEIGYNDKIIIPETPSECLLYALVTALFIGGIVNFFLTLKIIKEMLKLSNWPTVAVVIMTLFFPLEWILATLFVIPNIIIFGLKGRKKYL